MNFSCLLIINVHCVHDSDNQCSTGNGFLTGNGNGNENGKKCRERE